MSGRDESFKDRELQAGEGYGPQAASSISQGPKDGFRGLFELVDGVVRSEGLELYDLERTSGGGNGRSVLRVFLSKPVVGDVIVNEGEPVQQEGVSLEDCSRVSRKLSALDRFEEFIGENSLLEVSSPGINRKLRTEQHFCSALGERVSVKAYFESEGKERTVRGYLLACADGVIRLKPEHQMKRPEKEGVDEEVLVIELRNITNSRVDFDFSEGSNPKGKKQ